MEAMEWVALQQEKDYCLKASFGHPELVLVVDEPPPLGEGLGPSPVQLLATAVGGCLTNSLVFALRKFKIQAEPVKSRVQARVGRNEQGRLRVLGLDVEVELGPQAEASPHLSRALAQFESFCTVTQSVAQGIPVKLCVRDAQGQTLTTCSPDAGPTG